jgi:hypothetical protein
LVHGVGVRECGSVLDGLALEAITQRPRSKPMFYSLMGPFIEKTAKSVELSMKQSYITNQIFT